MACIILLLLVHIGLSANGYPNTTPKIRDQFNFHDEDPGSPLFLTPYIESGNIEEARNLSTVDIPGFPEVKSYAGFFTVDKTYNSNHFLWYFPAMSYNIKKHIVILWLNGGPGGSSLFGLFKENGPFEVKNGKFHKRPTHWAIDHHLIYIDNPVGTGFSFTNDSRGYCTNQTQIGEHLYTTLVQFFQLFPQLQKYDFFVSGESYAGKYVPALGYTIHKKNPLAKFKINLKGLMIGNGLCDPINQLDYSDYLYQIGLVDWNQKNESDLYQNQTIEYIKQEAWPDAYKSWKTLLSYLNNSIGSISPYNYLELIEADMCDFCQLLDNASLRKAIHVGNLSYIFSSNEVFQSLSEDIMKSVASWITELLEHYHMLFYNGQVDIIVAYPLTVNFLRKLAFSGSEEYLKAERKIISMMDLRYNSTVQIGFMKTGGKLSEALIRDAGHAVPHDKPDWILYLINEWRLNFEGA